MANYVWSKVICDKNTLERYFIDYNPFGDEIMENPYITFNKMFGLKSLKEYMEKIGIIIDYGCGFSYNMIDNDKCELMFCTRWYYPIKAIRKVLELSKKTERYLVEENCIYVSKFYWENGVKEKVMLLEKGYEDWSDSNLDFVYDIKEPDCDVWYYLQEVEEKWLDRESNNHLPTFLK